MRFLDFFSLREISGTVKVKQKNPLFIEGMHKGIEENYIQSGARYWVEALKTNIFIFSASNCFSYKTCLREITVVSGLLYEFMVTFFSPVTPVMLWLWHIWGSLLLSTTLWVPTWESPLFPFSGRPLTWLKDFFCPRKPSHLTFPTSGLPKIMLKGVPLGNKTSIEMSVLIL